MKLCVLEMVKIKISSQDLVPGDIIFCLGLKFLLMLESLVIPDLSFDRAILTGESKPIMATSFSEEPGTNYLESSCIAMQGTFVSMVLVEDCCIYW